MVSKVVAQTHDLSRQLVYAQPQPMSKAQLHWSLARLDAMDAAEDAIKRRVVAKNSYESLIYSSRDSLKDEHNAPYIFAENKTTLLALLDQVAT
jgi:hypothetical protein